jgi:hypothetical protein
MSRSHRAAPLRSAGRPGRRAGPTRNRARWPARRARVDAQSSRLGQSRPEVAWIRSARSRSCAISIQQAPFSRTGCHSPASVARDEVLEQDRTELDDAQRSLAPSDDGVDTRTVSVVRTDSAVAVTVQCGGVTARSTLAFAGDEIHEWIIDSLLSHSQLQRPNSSSGPGPPYDPGNVAKHIHRRRHGLRSGCYRVCQPRAPRSRGQIAEIGSLRV